MTGTSHVVTVLYVVSGDADTQPSQLFSYENMLVAKIVLVLVLQSFYLFIYVLTQDVIQPFHISNTKSISRARC